MDPIEAAIAYKKTLLKMALDLVIDGAEDTIELGTNCYINDVSGVIKEMGGKELEDKFDSNGWQWDFWAYYEVNGKEYCLSGSGYYGNLKFSLSEKEDD